MDKKVKPSVEGPQTIGASVSTQTRKIVLKETPVLKRDTKVVEDLPPSIYLVTGASSKSFELKPDDFIYSVGRGAECNIAIEDSQLSLSHLMVVKINEDCLFMDRGKRDLLRFDGIPTRQAFTPIDSRLIIKLGKHWLVYESSSITSTDTVSINRDLATNLPEASVPAKIHLQYKGTKFQSSRASCLIGTHQISDIRLQDHLAAQFTAFVYWSKSGIYIEKMGVCRASLCVNGTKISRPTKLAQGDIISVGQEEIFVKFEGDPSARCKTLLNHVSQKPEMALTVLSGAESNTFPLLPNNTYKVGRGTSSDIPLLAPSISREHSKLVVRDKCFSIEDIDSSNKTKLNLEEVDKATVFAGDIVELGDVALLAHYNAVRF